MSECTKHSLNYDFRVIKVKDMFQCKGDNQFVIERNMIYKFLTDPKISKNYKYNIKSNNSYCRAFCEDVVIRYFKVTTFPSIKIIH